LQHADGAVKFSNKAWRDFDLFNDTDVMSLPYPFELKSESLSRTISSDSADLPAKILWAELTWPEAEERLKATDIALLPVGAIEQHGPHLTLDVDTFDADYLAQQVAGACSDPKPLVLPPIAYGVSYHHDDFKGTISIGNDTLAKLIYEIGISVAKNGIKKLVIINGHGGNSPALNYAAQMINRDTGIFACVDTGETSDYDLSSLIETPNDVHAGEYETSTSLAIRPHLVKMDIVQKQVPKFSSRYLNFTSSRGIPWYARTKKISDSGVMGDPTKASADKGRKMWEIMIAHLTAFVEDLKNMTLDEIFQKRY
jgi:creatinine amidohydrolase/Fe(II)-dependent formamide hydrolase-like protein